MRRRLMVGVPGLIFLVLVGLWGYLAVASWQENRPETLFASAKKSFKQGEEAVKRDEPAAATQAFEQADARLQTLLAPNKSPKHAQGLVLRYHTLLHLAALANHADVKGQAAKPTRRPKELFAEARGCAELAAADPKNPEAQAAMLDACFRQDQLDLAERYARDLLDHLPEKPADDVDLHPYVMGAHFVLARTALGRTPPQPQEVLERTRLSDELQKRWVEAKFAGSADAPDVRTRWRMILLEAQALHLLAEAGGAQQGDEMQRQLNAWLERIRNDLKPAAAGAAKGPSPLTALPGRDIRSLLDFLTLAVELSPSRADALKRLLLDLDVCEALETAPKTPANATIATDAAQRYLYWPQLVEKVPTAFRLQPDDWATLAPRVIAVGTQFVEAGIPFDLSVFARWARDAQKLGQLDTGVRLTQLGLKAAVAQRIPAEDDRVLDLHAAAAWLCLLQKKTDEMEEHLVVLRKNAGSNWGLTQLLDGLAALESGQLERGLALVTLARKDPQIAQGLACLLGLAYGNVATGKYSAALPHLHALERYYSRSERIPGEYENLANRLSLHRKGLSLELFRCHLGLGNLDLALQYREQLRGEPEWLTAGVVLVRHHLGTGPTALSKTTLAARAAKTAEIAAARQELNDLQRAAPRDARLLLLEAEVIAIESEAFPEEARARGGPHPHLLTAWRGDAEEGQFAWACWLMHHGKLDEAGALLDRLEKLPPGSQQRRLAIVQNQWKLAGPSFFSAADQLLGLLNLAGDPAGVDMYVAGWDAAISRHEASGLSHFWRGQAAQVRGDWEAAAESYGRSMAFAPLQAISRRHLLACVLKMRDDGAAEAANEAVKKLLQWASPADPALLVAFIETALPLDNVNGPFGAARALQELEVTLGGKSVDTSGIAAYRAQTWLAAGRPDLARTAVEQALKTNPSNVPLLLLALRAAREIGDWQACLNYAEALETASPDKPEGALGKADALAHLGEVAEAEKLFRELTNKFPSTGKGYRGLVEILEQAKDYPAALAQTARWKARLPEDLDALQAEVRLLCRAGRAAEAGTVAEAAVRAAAKLEPEVLLAVARAYREASSLNDALAWGKRAEEAAAGAGNPDTLLRAMCLLGETCRTLAAQSVNDSQRRTYLDQAIDHYRTAFKDAPGNPAAGCPLAVLLAVDRNEVDAAVAIAQRLVQERASQKARSGDWLSLDTLDALGTVYNAAGRHQATIVLMSEAKARYGQEALVYLHLGRAQAALGQKAAATDSLNRAADLATDKSKRTRDAQDKSRWQDLARTARLAEQELNRP